MSKPLRTLVLLLFVCLSVVAVRPATATSCDYLVTCFDYLPEHQVAHPSWQYSHLCCDLDDHTTIWAVYIDFRGRWQLVSTAIEP